MESNENWNVIYDKSKGIGTELNKLDFLLDSLDSDEKSMESKLDINSQPVKFTNFGKLKRKSQKLAKDILKNMITFYLSDEMIEDDWTERKVKMDIQNLSNCIFQANTSEFTIKKVLEEIDAGAMGASFLKVFADLQKQNMEIMKYNKQYIQILEQEYANFAYSYESKANNENSTNSEKEQIKSPDDKIIVRGSTGILDRIEEEVIEEVIEGEIEDDTK